MDLALNRTTHDLYIQDYDLFLIDGLSLMQQRIKQSLWFFLGEWYLDITDGVPYFQSILVKAPDQVTVEGIIKQAILETPDVLELTRFEIEYENAIRKLFISFDCKTSAGGVSISENISLDFATPPTVGPDIEDGFCGILVNSDRVVVGTDRLISDFCDGITNIISGTDNVIVGLDNLIL